MNFAEKKKQQRHIIMSEKFDIIQRTMVVLRFPGRRLYQFSEILYHVT